MDGDTMKINLFFEAILKFLLGVVLVGILIFAPAGTISFFNGWLLMALLFVPMLVAGLVMMVKAPGLLESRLKGKEQQREQSLVVKLSGLMFAAGFVAAGLNYRFGWHELPKAVVLCAGAVFLLAHVLYGFVLKQNVYLSRTVRVQAGQTVVDTGLYALVRHPMYSATVLLFLSIPLILGSLYAFFVFLAYPVLIVCRIKNEEKVLSEELPGYIEYCGKVKYRLVPGIW